MTWEDLKNAINGFTEEQLKQDVTIYVSSADEFYSLVGDYPLVESDNSCDQLDLGSRYLVL